MREKTLRSSKSTPSNIIIGLGWYQVGWDNLGIDLAYCGLLVILVARFDTCFSVGGVKQYQGKCTTTTECIVLLCVGQMHAPGRVPPAWRVRLCP